MLHGKFNFVTGFRLRQARKNYIGDIKAFRIAILGAKGYIIGFGVYRSDESSLAERYSKPFSLPYRIVNNTLVTAEHFTVFINEISLNGLFGALFYPSPCTLAFQLFKLEFSTATAGCGIFKGS